MRLQIELTRAPAIGDYILGWDFDADGQYCGRVWLIEGIAPFDDPQEGVTLTLRDMLTKTVQKEGYSYDYDLRRVSVSLPTRGNLIRPSNEDEVNRILGLRPDKVTPADSSRIDHPEHDKG